MSIGNNRAYQVYTEAMFNNIIQEFDITYVENVIMSMLNSNIIHNTNNSSANIVAAYEQKFNNVLLDFPAERERILDVRAKWYETIIKMICDHYSIRYNIQKESEYYTIAYFLFEVFISNFKSSIVNFYTNYIIENKSSILSLIPKSEYDKVDERFRMIPKTRKKDKLPQEEMEHAVLSNNIYNIVREISARDISLYDYFRLGTGLTDEQLAFLFDERLSSSSDFVHQYIVGIILDDINANIFNDIRSQLYFYNFPNGIGNLNSGSIPLIYKEDETDEE